MATNKANGVSNGIQKESIDHAKKKTRVSVLPLRLRLKTWRWRTAIIVWFGFMNSTLMGNSFNMALVCMTGSDPPPIGGDNSTIIQNATTLNQSDNAYPSGEFDWDEQTQGIILSASLYLGFIAPAVAGFLTRRFGGKRVVGICLSTRSITTLLTPTLARTHLYALICVRVVAGCLSNMLSPASQELWAHWAPDQEKAQIVSATLSGVNLGSLVASLISGFLCTIPINGGWPFIFYVFGSVSVIWCVGWWTLVYDTPNTHPWVEESEKKYIEDNMSTKPDRKASIPYKAILTSRSVWAYFVISTVHRWCIVIFFTYLPKYMRDVLRFPIELNAVVSSVPFATRFVGAIFWGFLAEQMTKRNFSNTANRKIIQSTGFTVCAALTASLGFISHEWKVLAVVVFAVTMFFQSCTFAASAVLPLDIAPRLAAVINGVCGGAGNIVAMSAPLLVAYLTPQGTLEQWRVVFFILVGVYVFGIVVFAVFGNAEIQPWGRGAVIKMATTDKPEVISITSDGTCAVAGVARSISVVSKTETIDEKETNLSSNCENSKSKVNGQVHVVNGSVNLGFECENTYDTIPNPDTIPNHDTIPENRIISTKL